MMTRNECANWLKAHDHYVILTHRRPDGDTIGSAVGLCLGLRKLGKRASVLENREVTSLIGQILPGTTTDTVGENDTVITVDMASPSMFPDEFMPLLDRCLLRIDHHGTGTTYTPHELVDGHAAACGDIIYDVLMELDVKLDRDIGKALYMAVSSDTGCFRFANTDAHAFQVAAACAATGADLYPLTQALFDTNTLGKLKIQGWIVEHAKIFADGRAAVCAIPREVEDSVSRDDMEGVPGFLRSIEGVKICAAIRAQDSGSKMSVRAVPGYDAAVICTLFGGGGHKGAAGATMDMSLEEAEKAIIAALEDYLSK